MHATQMLWCTAVVTSPKGQSKHCDSPGIPVYCPSIQSLQSVSPGVSWNSPTAHCMHAVFDVPVTNCPAIHCSQAMAKLEYWPAAQLVHSVSPMALATAPIGQSSHTLLVLTVAVNFPFSQNSHCDETAFWYFPAAHWLVAIRTAPS